MPNTRNVFQCVKHVPAVIKADESNFGYAAGITQLLDFKLVMVLPISEKCL